MTLEAVRNEAEEAAAAEGLTELAGKLEPIEVLKTVRALENFWRPPIVKHIILAESHVYSDPAQHGEYRIIEEAARGAEERVGAVYEKAPRPVEAFPREYVRYICGLGYGDAGLFETEAPPMGRRPTKFWRLLGYAGGADPRSLCDNDRLVQANRDRRLSAKLDVLEAFMRRGFWLLQASYFGLYVPSDLRCRGSAQWQKDSHPFNHKGLEESLIELSQKDLAGRLKALHEKGVLDLHSVHLLGAKAQFAFCHGLWDTIQLGPNKVQVRCWPHPHARRQNERWDEARWEEWFSAHPNG